MLPGAFECTSGVMQALKLDPYKKEAGKSWNTSETWSQEQITSLQMSPRHRDR